MLYGNLAPVCAPEMPLNMLTLYYRFVWNGTSFDRLSNEGKLLEGHDSRKYVVARNGTSETLTIRNVSIGNHSVVCRTTNNLHTQTQLIVRGKLKLFVIT